MYCYILLLLPFCGIILLLPFMARHPQLRAGVFCWSKVLLPACPCRWQLVHSDAIVVLSGVASLPSNSVPLTADVLLHNCSTHMMYCYQIADTKAAVSLLSRNYEGQFPFCCYLHHRMVQLYTDSIAYHTFARVVFRYLPCSFHLPECPMVGFP